MEQLIYYLMDLMDESFKRNDASYSCSNFHHNRLEIIQDVLRNIRIEDVPFSLLTRYYKYCTTSIDFGVLSVNLNS